MQQERRGIEPAASVRGSPAWPSTSSRPPAMPIALADTPASAAAVAARAAPSCSRRDIRRSSSSATSSATPSAGFSGAPAAPLATTARNATISAGPPVAASATRSPARTPDSASRPAARSRACCSAPYESVTPDSGATRAGWLSDLVMSWRRLAGVLTVMARLLLTEPGGVPHPQPYRTPRRMSTGPGGARARSAPVYAFRAGNGTCDGRPQVTWRRLTLSIRIWQPRRCWGPWSCCWSAGLPTRSGQPRCCWQSTAAITGRCRCSRSGVPRRHRSRRPGGTERTWSYAAGRALSGSMRH